MPVVEFEGQQYDFPEDTTQDEMTNALSSLPKAEEEVTPVTAREPFTEEPTIKKDEGIIRNKEGSHMSYKDTKGFLTGGIGHLMTKEEKKTYPLGTAIPDKVVDEWFKTDIDAADADLTSILEDKSVNVPDEVYSILLNMSFNLGKTNLLEFKDMWTAVEKGDWKTVSAEMKDSDWFSDVKNRAVRLVNRMAAIKSDVQEEEAATTDNLTPSKGGLFEDENGKLFMVDEQGNKTEV